MSKLRNRKSDQSAQELSVNSSDMVENIKSQQRKWKNFDEFWKVISKQKGLNPELKQAVKAHFESMGFNHPSKFEAGLSHFGY